MFLILFKLFLAANAFTTVANALDLSGIDLPGAPAANSAEDIADYQALLQIQKTRSQAECERASSEVRISIQNYFGAPYGPLNDREVRIANRTVYAKGAFASNFIGEAKHYYKRPRPFVSHSDIRPCIKLEPSYSYPSGHATLARFYMHLLIEIFPAKKAALTARADEVAFDRSIGGVHYPTDVRDGKLLGDQIYQRYRREN